MCVGCGWRVRVKGEGEGWKVGGGWGARGGGGGRERGGWSAEVAKVEH